MSLNFGFSLPALAAYGGGGDNPFGQLGPTLDLSFANTVTDVSSPTSYTLDTNFITPQYQIATQYAIWETNTGLVAKNFGDIVTYTRSGNATYFDSTGTLQTAGANVPRFDYDPSTLAALGLLIEEQRTNSVANNTATGTVAGTPGTSPTGWALTGSANNLTRTIVGTGVENGIAYIDVQYSTGGGTTSASGNFNVLPTTTTAVAAASGQTWTGSTYVKLQAGSLANLTNIITVLVGRDAGGTLLENTSLTITPTNAALNTQRYVVSRTLNNASTAFVTVTSFQANYASGVTIDVTLRIGLPQLEQGAFATSVIQTSGTTATRNADSATITTITPWFNASEGTLFAQADSYDVSAARISFYVNDGTTNNRIHTGHGAAPRGFIATGGVTQLNQSPSSVSNNTSSKVALAYKANDGQTAVNGTAGTTITTLSVPTVNTVRLGGISVTNSNLNGHLQRVTYYPRRLSNAELQTITT